MIRRDHKDQLELINFKVPSRTKKKFQEICNSRNQQMTSILNQFLMDFIKSNWDIEIDNCHDDPLEPLDFYSSQFK